MCHMLWFNWCLHVSSVSIYNLLSHFCLCLWFWQLQSSTADTFMCKIGGVALYVSENKTSNENRNTPLPADGTQWHHLLVSSPAQVGLQLCSGASRQVRQSSKHWSEFSPSSDRRTVDKQNSAMKALMRREAGARFRACTFQSVHVSERALWRKHVCRTWSCQRAAALLLEAD